MTDRPTLQAFDRPPLNKFPDARALFVLRKKLRLLIRERWRLINLLGPTLSRPNPHHPSRAQLQRERTILRKQLKPQIAQIEHAVCALLSGVYMDDKPMFFPTERWARRNAQRVHALVFTGHDIPNPLG